MPHGISHQVVISEYEVGHKKFLELTLEPLSEEREEHGEVDWPRGLVHHSLEVLVRGVLAQGGEHVVQVLLVDEAVAVLTNKEKKFLNILKKSWRTVSSTF